MRANCLHLEPKYGILLTPSVPMRVPPSVRPIAREPYRSRNLVEAVQEYMKSYKVFPVQEDRDTI